MKKYNKPEIVTLALDVVDVIETSGEEYSVAYAQAMYQNANLQAIDQNISNMDDQWSW